MITYIRKPIKGFYAHFEDEIDPEYWAGKIGETYSDFLEGKWVKLSEEQAQFHEEHPNASVYDVLRMELPTTPSELEMAKRYKIADIEAYDNSENVNGFNVSYGNDTMSVWFTPSERANYRSSIEAAELLEVENLQMYVSDIAVTIPVQQAKMMLAQIQLYADQCFIVTKQHKAAVEALENVDDVENYDITAGYPQKLTFTIR